MSYAIISRYPWYALQLIDFHWHLCLQSTTSFQKFCLFFYFCEHKSHFYAFFFLHLFLFYGDPRPAYLQEGSFPGERQNKAWRNRERVPRFRFCRLGWQTSQVRCWHPLSWNPRRAETNASKHEVDAWRWSALHLHLRIHPRMHLRIHPRMNPRMHPRWTWQPSRIATCKLSLRIPLADFRDSLHPLTTH